MVLNVALRILPENELMILSNYRTYSEYSPPLFLIREKLIGVSSVESSGKDIPVEGIEGNGGMNFVLSEQLCQEHCSKGKDNGGRGWKFKLRLNIVRGSRFFYPDCIRKPLTHL